MITRRSLEGALKCALRDFRREEASPTSTDRQYHSGTRYNRIVGEGRSKESRTVVHDSHLDTASWTDRERTQGGCRWGRREASKVHKILLWPKLRVVRQVILG